MTTPIYDDTNNTLIDIGGQPWSQLQSEKYHLDQGILDTITDDLAFRTMAPVQENSIPMLLDHKDVIVEACTGSGKTLAYLVPTVELVLRKMKENAVHDNGEDGEEEEHAEEDELLLKKQRKKLRERDVYGLVICPTRELALQIYRIAKVFEGRCGVKTRLLIGQGASVASSKKRRKKVNNDVEGEEVDIEGNDDDDDGDRATPLVVGTPGRLLDVIRSGVIRVKDLEILILDEADRILDMGFEYQLNQLLSMLPKQRRTGLYSATQTTEMTALIKSGLRNPIKITVEVKMREKRLTTPKELTNYYMIVERNQKIDQLIALMDYHSDKKIIVYFLTCACVDFFGKLIYNMRKERQKNGDGGWLFSLHGKMVQKKRMSVFEEFSQSDHGILFCTDIAARGLDFPGVQYIVQFDPPTNPSMYVHRVGRTARMGRTGTSIVFLCQHEDSYIEYLEVKKIPIKEMNLFEDLHNYKPDMKEQLLKDRDLLEKCDAAIVSFIRAYREHQLRYIFKFDRLELDKVASAFCLLSLPNIWNKRFKKLKLTVPEENQGIDVDNIPYADPKRESARLLRIEKQKRLENDSSSSSTTTIKDKQKQKSQKRETLHEKKEKVRHDEELHSKKKRLYYQRLEQDELKNEEKLLKLLKKGKITEEEYEEMTGEAELMQSFQSFVPSAGDAGTMQDKKRKKKKSKRRKR